MCELSILSILSPVCGRHPQQDGTIFLPTRCALANRPVIGVRVIWREMASGWWVLLCAARVLPRALDGSCGSRS